MAIVVTSDFIGKYKVSQDQYTVIGLQKYIDKYTPKYLAKVLGAELSEAMITDIGAGTEPTNPDLLAIFEPFMYDSDCKGLIESNGIKEMLIGFIYYHYMVDMKVSVNPISGTSLPATENSTPTELIESQLYQRYNEAIYTGKAIQQKCIDNQDTYPTFKGSRLLLSSAF